MPPDEQHPKRKRETDDDENKYTAGALDEVDHEDGEEAPYDESKEPFPRHPAFDRRIAGLKESATAHMRFLRNWFAESKSSCPSLVHMQLKADKAMKMPKHERLVIALVGDTGAGKSSVLNAVTDDPNLARVVAGGESCTTVRTIYCDKLEWQTDSPYAAGIRYLNSEDCHLLMEEQLDNYNLYNYQEDESWTEEQRSEYSQLADTAMHTFRSVFCSRPEFEDEDAALATLEKNSNQDDGSLLATMGALCKEFLATSDDNTSDESYKFGQFDTAEELLDFVDSHTLPSCDYDVPSLAPLAERIDIGAQCSRLLQHVTIADLAGLTDTNKIRVKSTHKYIRSCQAMWYVVSVERIISDPNLDKTISTYAERFPDTLAIVVTKIDRGLDDALARKMRTNKLDVDRYFTLGTNLRIVDKTLKEQRMKTKRLKGSGSKAYFANEERVEEHQATYDKIVSERTGILVRARNEYVMRRLRQDKQKYLPAGQELPIICVSNSQYAAYKKVEGSDAKIMTVEETGVPALRAYALELVAPDIWEAIKSYLCFSVAGLVHGANAWAEADHMHRRAGLMYCVKSVQKGWNVAIDPVPQKLLDLLQNGFITVLRNDQKESLDGALAAHSDLCSWNSGSLRAFFRKEGKHFTKNIGKGCWNQLFLQKQTDASLQPAWDHVMPQLQHIVRRATGTVSKAIEGLPRELEQQPGSVPLAAGAFDAMLRPHLIGINAALESRSRIYEQTLRNLKFDATIDQPSAYFTVAMRVVYERYKRLGGDGVTGILRNALREHLCLPGPRSPFAIAINKLAVDLERAAKSYVDGLRNDIQGILDDITQQLNDILDGGVETPEETADRKAMLVALQTTLPEIRRI